jgi:catalase-peroxidase
MLHQPPALSSPVTPDFDCAQAFKQLDLAVLKCDLHTLLSDSPDWWPADCGHDGPFSSAGPGMPPTPTALPTAGMARASGQQCFAPLNSGSNNVNLDKARRLLWPLKQKYGHNIAWADRMVLTGNIAPESMGFKAFGFGFGDGR